MHDELFSRNGLSLERLRAFAEIVSAGGPTRAAKGDSTRQSQYSRQLKELEEFFGTELFVRRGGRWVLTDAGRNIQRLTNEHLGALSELRLQCAREPVAMRFAAGESFLQWRLLPKLAKIRSELSEARLVLLNRRSEDIAAGLLSGDLEFGILPPDEVPASVKSSALPPVEFLVFVPKALRVEGEENQPHSPHSPLELPLVLLEGGGATSEALMAKAAQQGLKLNVIAECSSYLQAAEVVRQGLAAGVLPAEAHTGFASNEVESHSIACLRKASRRIVLAWSAHSIRTRRVLARGLRVLVKVLT